MKICVLPGDGIGPEITTQAVRVLRALDVQFEMEEALLGGCAVDATGKPYPEATQKLARAADAILLGAVGGPQWDTLPRDQRPERGLLGIRKDLNLFANLRPAILYPKLANASTLKAEVVAGLDILIIRELTGDIYFGQPRGVREENGERVGFNTMVYSESEIRRIGHVAFAAARKRGSRAATRVAVRDSKSASGNPSARRRAFIRNSKGRALAATVDSSWIGVPLATWAR